MTASHRSSWMEDFDESERAVIGDLLQYPEFLDEVAATLSGADFESPWLARIFGVLLALAEEKIPVTLDRVDERLNKAGDSFKLFDLCDEIFSGRTILHAKRVAEAGRRRRIASAARRLAEDPDDLRARAQLEIALKSSGASEQAAPRLHLLTFDEFKADVEPAAIVKSTLFEGSTHNLTGASKSGKTWASLQLAMAVAAGEPFLGLAVAAARVLYLSFELSAGMLRGRMTEIHTGTEIAMPKIGDTLYVVAPTADYVPRLDLGADEGAVELERLIGETGARLVVLDTLYRFLPGADPNDNGQMGEVFGRLNDLAQRSGVALLLLDHVGKGEQLGPVSHSALGASVKGGAARVVIALRRTSREDGGRWQLDVESHFGSWEEPLYYERPRLPDGTRGGGCVVCSASEAHGLRFGTVRDLFLKHADRDDLGHLFFGSKRKLREALVAAKLAAGNQKGDEMIGSIMKDYCIPEYAKDRHLDRPILTRDGDRGATVFIWRLSEPEE